MSGTLLLNRADVEQLLTPEACFSAVEAAFRALGQGSVPLPAVLAMHGEGGNFHVKAGVLKADRPYFAAKLNANFPENPLRHALPTIQGVVTLFDAANGRPLAMMDSTAITALRTAAASAVAAKHLAREDCDTLLLCGCGGQAAAHLHALLRVRSPRNLLAYDRDGAKARGFADMAKGAGYDVEAVPDLEEAVRTSDIVVTCTPSRRYFITRDMVRPGTLICAVGADSEAKQEIEPELLASAKVVTDLTEQASRIGDLHHAVAAGLMTPAAVHAELGQVVAELKPGRTARNDIIVFDSTGIGLQDVAAAIAVYRRASDNAKGMRYPLG